MKVPNIFFQNIWYQTSTSFLYFPCVPYPVTAHLSSFFRIEIIPEKNNNKEHEQAPHQTSMLHQLFSTKTLRFSVMFTHVCFYYLLLVHRSQL